MRYIAAFVGLFLLCGIAGAQERPVVVLAPFDIQAAADTAYVRSEVNTIIENALKQNGADVIPADLPSQDEMDPSVPATAAYREAGHARGADFVVWGKAVWIGEAYRLSANVLNVKGISPARSLSVSGEGVEDLLASVQTLSRDIAAEIFKEDRVADILITGNKRIEDDAIKKRITTKPGDLFLPRNLTRDLKNVYAMGYFEDIRVEYEDSPAGKIIIFNIKEKLTIRKINFEGEDEVKEEELREAIDIRTGSIFNIFKIKKEVLKLESFYKEKNYHNVSVSYEMEMLENNQADLTFVISEGEEAKIQEIVFEGNHAFMAEELRNLQKEEPGVWGWPPFSWFNSSGELGDMGTEEEGIFSFLTDSGELNMETLKQDVAKLELFYNNHGYIDVRIAEPEVTYNGNAIRIVFKIDEGRQYHVEEVALEGDLIRPKALLLSRLAIGRTLVVNRSALRNDVMALTDLYANEGYFYADIYPRIDRNPEAGTAKITFVIKKNNLVYFEKILITGNTRTRDKVIRRELPMQEQELYNGARLKRGVNNLNRLDYFEDVNVNTLKGSTDDKLMLKIDVKEKTTGAFSFGGGYSSIEDFFLTASLTERNFLGRGQVFNLSAEVGGRTTQMNFSFTEPWLFDIPLSASLNLFNVERDYDTYTKVSTGGGVGFGYPVYDYTRLSVGYGYEENEYKDITEDASVYVSAGRYVLSKVTTKLKYDSRNNVITPSNGSEHTLTVVYAGDPLGGDYGFTQYIGETGWYFPLFWQTVGFLHGEAGYVRQNGNDLLLTEEYRFFLGGINSMRGYKWRSISPRDENGAKYGGNRYVLFNVEYIFPIFKKAGLNGVLFYDTGNVFDNNETVDLLDLRQTAGFGFRWNSPLGPIRIEYGHILDPREGPYEESGGRWEFSMGAAF